MDERVKEQLEGSLKKWAKDEYGENFRPTKMKYQPRYQPRQPMGDERNFQTSQSEGSPNSSGVPDSALKVQLEIGMAFWQAAPVKHWKQVQFMSSA